MLNFKHVIRSTFKAILYLVSGFLITSVFYTVLFAFTPVAYTPLMLIRSAEAIMEDKAFIHKHDWVSVANIDPSAPLAVVCAEDQNFFQHWGFDFEAIQESIDDFKRGKRLRGASTISQQTAKNIFLYPSRSWVRKGLEVYFTFLIELVWTKDRILTVYLNSIEFGTGIYGIEAASQHFFGHPASKLSRHEAALLAAVLPNPHRFHVSNPSNYIRSRQQWILRQMSQHNYELPREPVK